MLTKIPVKSADEIKCMREACEITAEILDLLTDFVRPGISTEDINVFVHTQTLSRGAKPSTLGYKGFTKSCCTSLNEIVCHGVPSPYVTLKEGDIINIDATSYKNGFHGDSSRMYYVGGEKACTPEAIRLVNVTYDAMWAGIRAVKPGAKVGDIGAAIQEFIRSTGYPYGIVREYTGHGVGREFHEPPQVVHVGKRGHGDILRPGMTFTVEPMINLGTHKTTLSKVDGWTVRTADGKLSAQWEHTILVTEDGAEALTLSRKEKERAGA